MIAGGWWLTTFLWRRLAFVLLCVAFWILWFVAHFYGNGWDAPVTVWDRFTGVDLAVIATTLSQGWTVDALIAKYMDLGKDVFKKDFFRRGIVRPRYDTDALVKNLKDIFGKGTKLGDTPKKATRTRDEVKGQGTGLLVMTKRMDTGSPWPLGNNPKGKYYKTNAKSEWISNADYEMWRVVKCSAAAPTYFEPEFIRISTGVRGKKNVDGEFVDQLHLADRSEPRTNVRFFRAGSFIREQNVIGIEG